MSTKETNIRLVNEVDFKLRVNGKLVESFFLCGSSDEEIIDARKELHKVIDILMKNQ